VLLTDAQRELRERRTALRSLQKEYELAQKEIEVLRAGLCLWS